MLKKKKKVSAAQLMWQRAFKKVEAVKGVQKLVTEKKGSRGGGKESDDSVSKDTSQNRDTEDASGGGGDEDGDEVRQKDIALCKCGGPTGVREAATAGAQATGGVVAPATEVAKEANTDGAFHGRVADKGATDVATAGAPVMNGGVAPAGTASLRPRHGA